MMKKSQGLTAPENAKIFQHGKGDVIEPRWTNIILTLSDMLMPLRLIPFYSKQYCQAHGWAWQSAHERVAKYLRTLALEDYNRPVMPISGIVAASVWGILLENAPYHPRASSEFL